MSGGEKSDAESAGRSLGGLRPRTVAFRETLHQRVDENNTGNRRRSLQSIYANIRADFVVSVITRLVNVNKGDFGASL